MRAAEWSEIDVSDSAWRILAEQEDEVAHVGPLAKQALAIIEELRRSGRTIWTLCATGATERTRIQVIR